MRSDSFQTGLNLHMHCLAHVANYCEFPHGLAIPPVQTNFAASRTSRKPILITIHSAFKLVADWSEPSYALAKSRKPARDDRTAFMDRVRELKAHGRERLNH